MKISYAVRSAARLSNGLVAAPAVQKPRAVTEREVIPVAAAQPRRSRRARLAAVSCAAVPLLAFCVFALSARLLPVVNPAAPAKALPPVSEELSKDSQVIDAVLARRAPNLGLTLRRQLSVAITQESARAGYDPLLILAIIDVESDFEQDAESPVGARGLMQIMPTTLYFLSQKEGLKLSRDEVAADPALQVRLGIRYLKQLHQRFGNLDVALMAYNAGPTKIAAALANHDADQYRKYPGLVHRDFRTFREGIGLGGDWALAERAH